MSTNRFRYFDVLGNELFDGSVDQVDHFAYRCRNDNDQWCAINVNVSNSQKSWTLTGTLDAPTITPIIDCCDCWHGFIDAGVYQDTNKTPEESQ